MPDPRDKVDIPGIGPPLTVEGRPVETPRPAGGGAGGREGRPYLRIWFKCSKQYARAYRDAAGRSYHARCPSCGKTLRFSIGPGGSSQRFFEVSC